MKALELVVLRHPPEVLRHLDEDVSAGMLASMARNCLLCDTTTIWLLQEIVGPCCAECLIALSTPPPTRWQRLLSRLRLWWLRRYAA